MTEPSNLSPPPYRIVTPRLVIRCYSPADAPLLKATIDGSLDHLRPFMPWVRDEPQPVEKKAALLRKFRGEFDLDHGYVYGIFDPDESQLLGGTGFHKRLEPGALEIGYWVRAADERRGLITESTSALIRVAFEIVHVRRLEIRVNPENTRSAAIPARLGFRHDGTIRQCIGNDAAGWHDAMVWTLLASEYPASPAARLSVEAFDASGERLEMAGVAVG